ncbi:MAG: family acetyltransferase [Crocinitomicaceae bacterium]|jgi:GNAT superfamily N-acetyltransferase|nr:family acetyltransferase [Crocinitomicaceae bacterium]
MIEIRTLNKAALQDFIARDEFPALPFIPISRHRAFSHIQNPRAEADQTLLLLAYEGETLVGYLGVLPEKIRINEQAQPCGFLSCLWIDPTHRGKKIAQKLLAKALEDWKNKILVTEFTFEAKILYDKTEMFRDLAVKEGTRLYILSDLAGILPVKKQFYSNIRPLLKIFDGGMNVFLRMRIALSGKSQNPFQATLLAELNDEVTDFISRHNQQELFRRNREELDWMLEHPWIIPKEKDDGLSRKYHFSSVADDFRFLPYSLRNKEGKMVAFLLFAKRDGNLKLPYAYFSSSDTKEIAAFIFSLVKELRIKTFTTFNPELSVYFAMNRGLAFHAKQVKRKYIISKEIGMPAPGFEIQDGDADCAFT